MEISPLYAASPDGATYGVMTDGSGHILYAEPVDTDDDAE